MHFCLFFLLLLIRRFEWFPEASCHLAHNTTNKHDNNIKNQQKKSSGVELVLSISPYPKPRYWNWIGTEKNLEYL